MITLSRYSWNDWRRERGWKLRRHLIGIAAIVGGLLLVAGTLLPWLTLFAGLRALSGLAGINGRILLAGGMLSILAGLWSLVRSGASVRWSIGLLGFALLAFTGWLSIQLITTYRSLAADPFMVAALGPGLFVALGGALLLFLTLFLGDV